MERSKGPEALSEVLGRLFISRGWGRLSERAKLESLWNTVAGEFKEQTRVMSLRRGVLAVEVNSGVVLQELNHFHKKRILKALREAMPHLTFADLKFRGGSW
jgi:predicted nucleic acid-binding Zn ribbon protein